MAILSGKLSEIPLVGVLEMLSASTRTGRLELMGARSSGEIFFEKGRIVHTHCESFEGEDALFSLLGWDEGAFEFTPTDSVPAHTIGLKMDELLDRARSCAQKWADLKTIIPSNESILMVSRALKQEAGEISLSPSEWGTLLLVNGRRRVREIAAQTRLSEFETTKILGKLLSMGLLELKAVPTPPEAEVVTPEMLDELRKELTLLIGPMARMILERVAEEMGETLDDLPLYRLSEFLDALSIQIPKPQRERFEVKVNHWKRSWKLTKGGER